MISQLVISLDGSSENLVEHCLDLPSETYNELVSQLDDMVAKKKK